MITTVRGGRMPLGNNRTRNPDGAGGISGLDGFTGLISDAGALFGAPFVVSRR